MATVKLGTPKTIATLTGPDGFETCYVSLAKIVASDGAIVGTPSVTPESGDVVASAVALNGTDQTVNGTTYSAGELLSFKLTAQAEKLQKTHVKVTFETAKQKETLRYAVEQRPWEVE